MNSETGETARFGLGVVAIVCAIATVFFPVTSCTERTSAERTKQVQAACSGDLTEVARAVACSLAISKPNPQN